MNSETDMSLIDHSLKECVEAIRGIETSKLKRISEMVVRCYANGGKVMLCGNGGSASQAQHIAAELVCKFRKDRGPFPALALTTDTSILTAQSNDVGYETVFERQVEAHGRKGDVLIALSTSGNSQNVVRALRAARNNLIKTVVLTGGNRRSEAVAMADEVLFIESSDTPRIQEAHIVAGHIICELVETEMANRI